jgi:hypothetical protein
MEEIKFLDSSHENLIEEIVNSHKKNVGVEKTTITNFMLIKNLKLALSENNTNAKVVGFFRDGILISFLHFYSIQGIPYWYLAYWSARKENIHFNRNGILKLWDFVCDYMESMGVYNFYFARPEKYGITLKVKFQTKLFTKYNLQIEEIVEKGEHSRFSLFNQIVFNNCKSSTKIIIISGQLKHQYRTLFIEASEVYKMYMPEDTSQFR